jgi:hypothetical protein
MRNFLAVVLAFVSAVCAAQSEAAAQPRALRPFVGTWRLVSSVEQLPDGTTRPYGFGPHARGYLMYDASGHACAQVVDPDRPAWKDSDHPTAQELESAYAGFGGYCGRYTVDEKTHTAAHIPEVSFDPTLAGQSKPRRYRFEGGRLIYSGVETMDSGGKSHWTMIWERVK